MKNNSNNQTYTRTELIIESVIVSIGVGVSILVLTTGFTFLWEVGKVIWKTLIK